MEKTFFKTGNVNRLDQAMTALTKKRNPKDPGIGAAYGNAGRGKSEAVDQYYSNNPSFYVSAVDLYKPRWMLKDICLAIEPMVQLRRNTDDLFGQCVGLIRKYRAPIFIDEADYLFRSHCIDTVRDLFDKTDVPFVLIGMDRLISSLAEKNQIWSRVLKAAVVEWQPLSSAEILMIIKEWTGLNADPVATDLLCEARRGDFRDLMSDFVDLESACQANKTNQITSKMVEAILTKAINRRKIADQTAKRVRIVGREMHLTGTA